MPLQRQRYEPLLVLNREVDKITPHKALLTYGLPALLGLGLLAHALDAFDENGEFKSSGARLAKRVGSEAIANDLYGLGVRIGLYMQAVGMLLSVGCLKVGGVKIAFSATILALLATWTRLALARAFSACEAFLVLTMAQCLGLIAGPASMLTIVGETGIGNLSVVVAMVWSMAVSLWFWSTLYRQLPRLQTQDQAWMFAKVSIRGWFRIFSLVGVTISVAYAIVSTVMAIVAIRNAAKAVLNGKVYSQAEIDKAEEQKKIAVRAGACFCAVILVLTIASAEMIIRYNGLTPVNEITTPSQIIPLTIGVIVLGDGIWTVVDVVAASRA